MSQAAFGGDERRHGVATATVPDSLLSPRVVAVKRREPHPGAGGLGKIHVREVIDSLATKPTQVIDKDGVIGVVIRARKRQRAFLDLYGHQRHRVWGLNVIRVLVVLSNDDLFPVGDRQALGPPATHPTSFRQLAISQR